ncbi:MAG: HD domain-containing protein [Chloroflexi bacterium]|nr:HD domain-containing protein [Chloroflexota bacterium]
MSLPFRDVNTSEVRLAELIAALSLATDLGMGQPMDHALRRCLIAVRLGEALGLSDHDVGDVYYVGLVCSVGCTIKLQEFAPWFQDELTAAAQAAMLDPGERMGALTFVLRRVGQGYPPLHRAKTVASALTFGEQEVRRSSQVCHEVCTSFGEMLGLETTTRQALGQMHERWDGHGQPQGLKGEEKALPARIAHLAGDADIFHRMGGVDTAMAVVRRRSGKTYDPRIAELFCQKALSLFAQVGAEPIWDAVLAAEPAPQRWIGNAQLDTIVRALAHFADVKSPYTVGHSTGVAALAETAARKLGLSESEVTALRRTALLHDLGRIGIPIGIWDKPGPLTQAEWERVRMHPYLTERVLARSGVLGPLGMVAALHHERLDGSGYHRGMSGSSIPTSGRTLAAADFFHTKTEPRPHRPALTPEAAQQALRQEVQAGRIDADAASAVLSAAGQREPRQRHAWPGQLTDREVEVLRLMSHASSNREIARALDLSPKTVDHHVQHIYDKIGVSTRVAATLFAMRHDLLGDKAT